jgi:hypothetical protein
MNKKFRITIELIPTNHHGGMYVANLTADTPHGRLDRSGGLLFRAKDGWNVLKRKMASVERTATRRGPGRRPKDYQQCRDVVFGYDAI